MTQSLVANVALGPDQVVCPAPRMRLSGSTWLDEAGVPLAKPLRGWNWGRWGTPIEADADAHVDEGATVVRIPLRWVGYYQNPGSESYDANAPGFIDPAHLLQLDQYIAWCVSRGLRVILFRDSNCGQNGSQDQATIDYCRYPLGGNGPGGQNFYNNAQLRADFWAGWRFIAKRYRYVPGIAMFEISPEQDPPGLSASAVKDFYAEGIEVIRAEDPDTILLIGGPNAYNIVKSRQVYDQNFRNVAYTGNMLGPTLGNSDALPARFSALLDVRDTFDAAIFVQQVGCESGRDPNNTLLPAGIDLCRDNDVGYTVWSYRGNNNADGYEPYFTLNGQWVLKQAVYDGIVSRF